MSHLKKLTLPDLARRLYADEMLKHKLAGAVQEELAPTDPSVGERAYAAIHTVLEKMVKAPLPRFSTTEPVRYKVECRHCDLDRVIETTDWRVAGIAVVCCVCGHSGTFGLPEGESVIRCSECGAETVIRRVRPSA
jgi:hypothetical protein